MKIIHNGEYPKPYFIYTYRIDEPVDTDAIDTLQRLADPYGKYGRRSFYEHIENTANHIHVLYVFAPKRQRALRKKMHRIPRCSQRKDM